LHQAQPEDSGELFQIARSALIDYLASLKLADREVAVQRLVEQLKIEGGDTEILSQSVTTTVERAALINGFQGHYLDYDDVQPNFRGHPSVTIFSALFAIAAPTDQIEDLLWAYIQGVEVAGQFGRLLNPHHAVSGWHSTATIGSIASAAAISVFKRLSVENTVAILSVAASQTAGMLFQAGTDNKPLHAGLAARNAVTAYQIVQAGLTTSEDLFNNRNGWFKVIGDLEVNATNWRQTWLKTAQIQTPGLWFKQHQFCSAAISGYDAAVDLWQKGIQWKDCQKIVIHYPQNGDRVLNQSRPQTGQQGKFSIEYIVWQVLNYGDVDDQKFAALPIEPQFYTDIEIFSRTNDLPQGSVTSRPARLEVFVNGASIVSEVDDPLGSPANPLPQEKIIDKLQRAIGAQSAQVEKIVRSTNQTVSQLVEAIK
jgi:2-methylcitrate dehydratase PrpD